jgi:hypothetical protein
MVEKYAQAADNTDVNSLDMMDLLIPLSNLPSLDVEEDIEVSEDEPNEIIFTMDKIPGAPDAEDIIVENEDDNVEVEEDPENSNMWKWEHPTFLNWVKKMFDGVPKHSGYDTTGLEKCIAYFEAIDRELTKAMRTDFKNEIDSAKAERAREQIEEGLERLVERLNQVKKKKYKRHTKKSWAENVGILKEAGKAPNITGITVTVPLLISRIARVCINGMVSAGHDMEDMFHKQVEEYKLDKREQAEVVQLLEDMGYPIITDRGYAPGTHVDKGKNDNFDWAAQYPR